MGRVATLLSFSPDRDVEAVATALRIRRSNETKRFSPDPDVEAVATLLAYLDWDTQQWIVSVPTGM